MALYMVDYENTGVRGIAGIEGLRSTDRLIILYGPKTGSVPFEDMVKMTSSPAAVEFVRTTKTAKNYLDFQLTTYIGYLIAQRSAEKYYIISRDSGFDAVLDFWSERGIQIERFVNLLLEGIQEQPAKATAAKETAAQKPASKAAEKSASEKKQAAAGRNKGTEKQKTQTENPQRKTTRAQKQTPQSGNQDGAASQGVPTVPESVKKKIRSALKEEGLRAGGYRKVYMCMLESDEKSALNTAMVHAFGQDKGNKYYKQILPAFAAWRNLS